MSKCGRSICDQITSGCLGECLSDYRPLHTRECDDKISKLEAELDFWKSIAFGDEALTSVLITENQKLRDELNSKVCPVCGFPKHKFQEQALEDE